MNSSGLGGEWAVEKSFEKIWFCRNMLAFVRFFWQEFLDMIDPSPVLSEKDYGKTGEGQARLKGIGSGL